MVTGASTTVSKLESRVGSLEKGVKNIQHKMVYDSIRNLVASGAPPSLAEVESILKELGLGLNQEIGEKIASSIPSWAEAKHVTVPLKHIEYHDSGVLIPLNGEGVNIPVRLLPFETSVVLNKIKGIFEGNLEAFIDKKFYFQWSSDSRRLTIEDIYVLRKKITVDDASLRIFKKVEELRARRGPFKADSYIEDIFEPSNPERVRDKGGISPKLLRKDPDYNPECIDILMDMADICYVTDRDFWFRIDDVLVWEEPRYSKATYISKWPEEPLQIFIFRIWISELWDIRNDPESGYIDRANHVPNVADWKANVEAKIQDVEGSFVLGKVTIP